MRPAELHRGTPWLLQDLVDARFDVTVVYVRGGIFAFELDRTAFTDKSVDWREVGELTTSLCDRIDCRKTCARASKSS